MVSEWFTCLDIRFNDLMYYKSCRPPIYCSVQWMRKLFRALCYSYIQALIYRDNYLYIATPIEQKRNFGTIGGTFNKYRLHLTPVWMSNYIHYGVGDIIYTFTVFDDCTVEIWEWTSNSILYFTAHLITYSCWDSMLAYNFMSVRRDPAIFDNCVEFILTLYHLATKHCL